MNTRDWNDLPPVLTLEETARILRCGYRRVLELCRRGDFPAMRLGRRWLINRDKLRVWIDARCEKRNPGASTGLIEE